MKRTPAPSPSPRKKAKPASSAKAPAAVTRKSPSEQSTPARVKAKPASPAKGAGPAARKRAASAGPEDSRTDPDVLAFLEALEHPLKDEVAAIRRLLLDADPSIHEAIKWNAPSFRTTDFFATFHLRAKDAVQLVFHMGAKAKATAKTGVDIPDPEGLLKWLAKDRALVTLGAGEALEARKPALQALVREWIRWL